MAQFHRPQHCDQSSSGASESVTWPQTDPVAWLQSLPLTELKDKFEKDGFLVVENVLTQDEVKLISDIYAKMLSGEIDVSNHRHDLGNLKPVQNAQFKENVCQIMWPSVYIHRFDDCPGRLRLHLLAKFLLGDDMAFDFDMMIAKPPLTNTETPWHQDESYWLDMTDKRAMSCWIAIDETTLDNGCMWFGKGSHKEPLRPHGPAAPGVHILTCAGNESEGTPCPIKPGSCTIHTGRTMHYSRGNSTEGWRRGYIINYRPESMVQFERDNQFDHGKAGLNGVLAQGQFHK